MLVFHHVGKELKIPIKGITLMTKFLRSGAIFYIHLLQYEYNKSKLIQLGFMAIK